LLTRAKCEPTFDELNGALDRDVGIKRNQDMEVVGHDHEIVQQDFFLQSVVVQNINE